MNDLITWNVGWWMIRLLGMRVMDDLIAWNAGDGFDCLECG